MDAFGTLNTTGWTWTEAEYILAAEELLATRYINAAAFVILLYDHLLTLGGEIELIWPAKWSSPKAMFLFIRYMVPCFMTLFTVQLSAISHISLSDSAFAGFATLVISNFLILLRLWVIWGRDRKLMIYTSLLFMISLIAGLISTSVLVWKMQVQLYWNSEVRMCGFHHPPPLAVVWIPGTVFEIVLCGITWWYTLCRPRSTNEALAAVIYRDGLFFYYVSIPRLFDDKIRTVFIAGLRIANTILSFTAPHYLIFIAMFPVWCATTTTTCRLIIKLRHISVSKGEDLDSDQTSDQSLSPGAMSVVARGEYDELVRSGVQVEMLRAVGPSTPIRSSGWY
ncbi:hypothetical protein DFH07DRAFT_953117 [Mycena maculata]|uniref:DUF6533 domain-containing protein n=1 Tax=Mycena maculata TaxID=230809 RepID=A0AAD7NSD9_9AGAR|nr:hypothetical protein DFH07DRAFT_953117 [Mycena maculata]